MDSLYLIVGLGNPGAEYARTRHNAGFMAVTRLAARWQADWTAEKKFKARVARQEIEGRKVLLALPRTFMNASGETVGPLAAYHRVPTDRLLVVTDDADLPLGELRLRPGGGTGGHHGLESVTLHLGTPAFARLRLGIGRRADGVREITDYVLAAFSAAEAGLLEKVLTRACDQIECWLREGMQKAMNRFNGMIEIDDQQRHAE